MQISQVMLSTKFVWGKISQLICIRNAWFFAAGLYLMCYTLGTRGFLLRAADRNTLICLGEAARKTSGIERFYSLFLLTFHQFSRITFKPMTVSISHCDHVDWHLKTQHIDCHVVYLTLMCVMVDITALYQRMLKNWKFWKNLHF